MHISRPSLVLLALLLSGTPSGLRAEGSPPAAHVRFWKTDLRSLPGVRLSLKSTTGRKTGARDLGSGGPGYLFDDYIDAPAGHGTLEVYTGADPHPLISQPADLASGTFVTALLREGDKPGDAPRLEVIVDAGGGTAGAASQITVRSFVTDLKNVQVKVGDSVTAQFQAGQGFMQMGGIKPAVYPIYTAGVGPDGKPFEWNTETDLKQHRHQTLLIYPDPYGRIRPRLCIDGENQAAAPDVRGGQH